MRDLEFKWDAKKAKGNARKHGVEFDEAATVFLDDNALLISDPDHSKECDQNYFCSQGYKARATDVRRKELIMRKQYDFSKGKRNPYSKRLKRQITIRLDGPTIDYFKELSEESGIPYQTLINLYLRDCATSGRKLSMRWKKLA